MLPPALLPRIALCAILGAFIAVIGAHYVPAYTYTDTDGDAYLQTARGLARHGDPAQRNGEPFAFIGEQMVEARAGVYYSKYSIGYPLLAAGAYALGGASAPFLVNPLLALLTLVGLYRLAAELTGSRGLGVCAVALLASNPVHLCYALSPLSHTASLCAATWSMLFLWRWTQTGGLTNAALAGALVGFGATVRYPDALLVLPVLAMVAWRAAAAPQRLLTARDAAVMGLAALLLVIPQLLYQAIAFGSPWTSGYALSRESTAFSWAWFTQHAPIVARELWHAGFLPLPVLALLGLLYLARAEPQRALFLALWSVPIALLYCSYYFITPGFYLGTLRYFLVVLPAWIVSALLPIAALHRPHWRRALLALFLLLVLPLQIQRSRTALAWVGGMLQSSHGLSQQVRAVVPSGAVLLSLDRFRVNALVYFLDYEGRYDLIDLSLLKPDYLQHAKRILAGNEPTPYQPARLAKIVSLLDGQDANTLAAMQRDLVKHYLERGRTVMLLTADEPQIALRPLQGDLRLTLLREIAVAKARRLSDSAATPDPPPLRVGIYAVELLPAG